MFLNDLSQSTEMIGAHQIIRIEEDDISAPRFSNSFVAGCAPL
jgi:hypothetical protein